MIGPTRATAVITSLASALPVVGYPLVSWLWGGLSVENATLNRFLSLHYLLPFIIAGNSVVHLAAAALTVWASMCLLTH